MAAYISYRLTIWEKYRKIKIKYRGATNGEKAKKKMHRMPPLSFADKLIYRLMMALLIAAYFVLVFGPIALRGKIAYQDAAVLAKYDHLSLLWLPAPFMTFFLMIWTVQLTFTTESGRKFSYTFRAFRGDNTQSLTAMLRVKSHYHPSVITYSGAENIGEVISHRDFTSEEQAMLYALFNLPNPNE